MLQSEFYREMANVTGESGVRLTQIQCERSLAAALLVAKSEVESTGTSKIPGLGLLRKVTVQKRDCRNPATGGRVTVPEHVAIKCKISKKF